jgi:hypothetical protein
VIHSEADLLEVSQKIMGIHGFIVVILERAPVTSGARIADVITLHCVTHSTLTGALDIRGA